MSCAISYFNENWNFNTFYATNSESDLLVRYIFVRIKKGYMSEIYFHKGFSNIFCELNSALKNPESNLEFLSVDIYAQEDINCLVKLLKTPNCTIKRLQLDLREETLDPSSLVSLIANGHTKIFEIVFRSNHLTDFFDLLTNFKSTITDVWAVTAKCLPKNPVYSPSLRLIGCPKLVYTKWFNKNARVLNCLMVLLCKKTHPNIVFLLKEMLVTNCEQ